MQLIVCFCILCTSSCDLRWLKDQCTTLVFFSEFQKIELIQKFRKWSSTRLQKKILIKIAYLEAKRSVAFEWKLCKMSGQFSKVLDNLQLKFGRNLSSTILRQNAKVGIWIEFFEICPGFMTKEEYLCLSSWQVDVFSRLRLSKICNFNKIQRDDIWLNRWNGRSYSSLFAIRK